MAAFWKWVAIGISGMAFLSPAAAIEITGPAEVVDGDTIEIGQTRIRLDGIDAPEFGQLCKTASDKTWPCGEAAMARLKELIPDEIRCEGETHDDYGRLIAVCWAGQTNINATLVEEGYAWAFTRYSDEYAGAEDEARSAGMGIWQAVTQAPWDFRAERWRVAEQTAPDGCPIKGNISKNGRIYHVPWSPWYKRTKISTAKGERWFCNEAEALAAGWRAPYW